MRVHRMTNLSVMEAKELLDSYVTGVTPLVPCKVGDVFYEIVNEKSCEVRKTTIKRIECDERGWCIWHTPENANPMHQFRCSFLDFKNKFFRTKQLALSAAGWRNEG